MPGSISGTWASPSSRRSPGTAREDRHSRRTEAREEMHQHDKPAGAATLDIPGRWLQVRRESGGSSFSRRNVKEGHSRADVAKPVDARDLKSLGRKAVRVRPPPSAPIRSMTYGKNELMAHARATARQCFVSKRPAEPYRPTAFSSCLSTRRSCHYRTDGSWS